MEELLRTFDLVPRDVPMILLGSLAFLIFCKVFGKFVIVPFLQLLEAREAASLGAIEEATADLRASEELQKDFELKIGNARSLALIEKNKVIEAAKKDAAHLLDNAEAQARQHLESERASIKQAVEEAKASLQYEEESLISLIMQKLEQGKELNSQN